MIEHYLHVVPSYTMMKIRNFQFQGLLLHILLIGVLMALVNGLFKYIYIYIYIIITFLEDIKNCKKLVDFLFSHSKFLKIFLKSMPLAYINFFLIFLTHYTHYYLWFLYHEENTWFSISRCLTTRLFYFPFNVFQYI